MLAAMLAFPQHAGLTGQTITHARLASILGARLVRGANRTVRAERIC